MNGDFSRRTFDPGKRYAAVLMQQGRVQVDADFTEAQDIHLYRDETEAVDVIGPTGVPRVNPGFAVALAGGGTALTISKGHLYVDGVLFENDTDALALTAQPDLPGFTLPAAPGAGTQRYILYVDGWQRHITAIEDPSIRETALGGPDTATRSRTVWQVRLSPVAADATCASLGDAWTPPGASQTGTLTAHLAIPPATDGPCVLPGTAGFRGLENQLYRVEIHRAGTRGAAVPPTIKWSRDNGSVVTAIDVQPGQTVTGPALTVEMTRLDDILSFAPGDWVEVLDDRMELNDQHGVLAQIDTVVHATRTITLKAGAPALSLQRQFHPKLRRWDQQAPGDISNGIPMPADATHVVLENGVEVEFGAGDYRSGDYWMIPARTAISSDTGTIEWPQDGAGNFLPQPGQGIHHHFCKLALVDLAAGGAYTLVPDGDCRKIFPPLTAITAADVSYDPANCALDGATNVQEALEILCARKGGGCTITLVPGAGWEEALKVIADNQDTDICFQPGDYPVEKPVVLAGKGHLKITGVGPGTRVLAPKLETALRFERCRSVTIRDLYAEAGVAGSGDEQRRDLNGVLTFADCGAVNLDNVTLRTADGMTRAATCVTVRNSRGEGDLGGQFSAIRIQGSTLQVGFQQTGILLINAGRAQVEDNLIQTVTKPENVTHKILVGNRFFRANIRRTLLSEAGLGGAMTAGRNAVVDLGGHKVSFRVAGTIAPVLSQVVNAIAPVGAVASDRDVLRHTEDAIDKVIANPQALAGAHAAVFENAINAILNQFVPFSSQGIVLGGTAADDVRILNNTIRGTLQGIHIGVSHREPSAGRPDAAGRILIAGNTIEAIIPSTAVGERHGIFCGHNASLLIENNALSLRRFGFGVQQRVEGIRVYGNLGALMIVRQNHMAGFTIGAFINPLNYSKRRQQWLVADNMAVSSQHAVEITPPAAGLQPVRESENYA